MLVDGGDVLFGGFAVVADNGSVTLAVLVRDVLFIVANGLALGFESCALRR